MRAIAGVALAMMIAGCAEQAPAPTSAAGPVARSIEGAADEAGVPRDLLLAIAIEEGGVRLAAIRQVADDDVVPVAGRLELRHGKLDTLAMGARLMATSEDELRADTELGTRAGARVVAALGATDDPATWRGVLETLSGMDAFSAHNYASRVLAILRSGGAFPARDGETIAIAAHAEIAAADTQEIFRNAGGVADFPGAIWFDTSCTNKCTIGRPLGNASVDKIVIHDTEGGWDGSVATLQNDGGKSVHYIIDADGSRVGQFRPETDTTWHAGNYFYNETSVGIEHVGVASDPAGYSTALYAKSRELVQSIRTRWTVPLNRAHIFGHYQVPNGNNIAEDSPPCDGLDGCETSANYGGAGNHRDPGYYWQWCQYMEALGGTCTCADAWPLWNCTTDLTEAVRCADGTVEIAHCADGCEVMPIGTEDVCHGATSSGDPDAGTSSGDPDAGTGDPADGGGVDGGCCSTGGGGSASATLALAALAVICRRRRRPIRGSVRP